MPSYEPVDLSAVGNAGLKDLGDAPGDVPLGRVALRGLPFLIGSEPASAERCFLLPGVPVAAGIGRPAPRVIIAHRLLEPGAPAGHAVGQTVAEYVFHLAGWSSKHRRPRRDCRRVARSTSTGPACRRSRPTVWPDVSRLRSRPRPRTAAPWAS